VSVEGKRRVSSLAAAALAIAFAGTIAAQSRGTAARPAAAARPTTLHWVTTWSTSPVARVNAPAPAATPTPPSAAGATTAAPAGATAPAAGTTPPSAAAPGAAAAQAGARGAAPGGAAPGGRAGAGGAAQALNPLLCGAGGGGRGVMAPNNQTLRQIVHLSLGGDRFRIVVSNAFGTVPLEIGAASIALRGQGGGVVSGSSQRLTFSGSPIAKVSPGATMISDPVSVKAPDFADLAIDLFLPGDTGTTPLTRHAGACQTNYIVAGNHVGEADMASATPLTAWYFLQRVEVVAPAATGVIVAAGDSITDGTNSTIDTNSRWPDVFAKRLAAQKGMRRYAVVNAAIAGNRVISDVTGDFGVNIQSRLDRDVLAETGATHVVFMEGINDIGGAQRSPSPTADDIIAAHRQVIARAHAQGLKIYGATLTPTEGHFYYTEVGEAKRQKVNEWIRTGGEYDGVIDFDAAIRDPERPTRMLPKYESPDHLHPGDAGYKAMADAIKFDLFK